jgi:ankyrin repeat protein
VVTEAQYQRALVAAICRLSAAVGEDEHLAVLLARHPKLVNERYVGEPPGGKPTGIEGEPPLLFAIRARNTRGVAVLIAHKADVNADRGEWTPLHYAARFGQLEVCKLLIEAGAKPDAKTTPVPAHIPPSSPSPRPGEKPFMIPARPAYTPLDLAKEGNHKEVVEYLSGLTRP